MFSFNFIEFVLGCENKKGFSVQSIKNFVIDSVKVKKQDCFIGLKGIKQDGGDFIEAALKNGAIGFILHKKYESVYLDLLAAHPTTWAFFVEDTKIALINLAKKWRSLFDIPIIAITGSVGKTTTKELIKTILTEQKYFVCATKNSENGTIGLPLSILSMRQYHSIAVFEVGIQKPGEMDLLIDLLQSVTYSIITTILPAHILYFKTIECIISEKIKLQNITTKILFIDVIFKKYISHKNFMTFGGSLDADVNYNRLDDTNGIEVKNDKNKYRMSVLNHQGLHHCIAGAVAFGLSFGLDLDKCIDSIEKFKSIDGRFSIHHLKNGSIIINDCWNSAHGEVMLKSIQAFKEFNTNNKKIMVLADMLEQGDNRTEMHDLIVKKVNMISENEVEKVFYIGSFFTDSAKQNTRKNVFFANSFLEVADEIYDYLNQKYCILFKGSNGMKLFYYISHYINNNIGK
jgi:UDP-N-acetylmuramoyl-tripeptide--D-alanyl-D-alanine ligase